MNYYRLHIGDYLRDTAHLSLLEHGVYARLLQVYYTREAPIADGEKYRLIGARSPDEREAVDAVLAEFFTLTDGVWMQSRCNREIAEYQSKAERNREVGKLGGNPKKKRGYNELGWIYAIQRADGGPIKVGISKHIDSRLSALRKQVGAIAVLAKHKVCDMGAAEADVHDAFKGRLDGDWVDAPWAEIQAVLGAAVTRIGSPDGSQVGAPASSQEPKAKETHTPRATPVELAIAMRKAGVPTHSANPEVMALAEQGVSVETAVAACDEARKRLPGEQPPVGYVVRILESWARRAGAAHVNGATVPRAGLDDTAIARIQAELEAEERNAAARI